MYHVSILYLGKRVILTPKIPETRGKDECSLTKRVCVSPTVKQCLFGINGINDLKYSGINKEGWNIYKTQELGIPAINVFDYRITHEHWILKECEFQFVGRVLLSEKNELIIETELKI